MSSVEVHRQWEANGLFSRDCNLEVHPNVLTLIVRMQLRFCCEVLTLLAVLIRTSKDVVDMQQIGMKRWWIAIVSSTLASFTLV